MTQEDATPDFTAQWDQVQAFAAQRGVTVPDLPEPAMVVALEEAKKVVGVDMRRDSDIVKVGVACYNRALKVRAEYEGEG